MVAVSNDELKKLIADGVEAAFRDVGLNQEEVFELRKDLTFLREQRLMCETLRTRGLWYALAIICTGAASLFVLGFRAWIFGGHV